MVESCKMQHKLAVLSFLISTIGEKGGWISDLQLQSTRVLKIFMQCQTLTSFQVSWFCRRVWVWGVVQYVYRYLIIYIHTYVFVSRVFMYIFAQ